MQNGNSCSIRVTLKQGLEHLKLQAHLPNGVKFPPHFSTDLLQFIRVASCQQHLSLQGTKIPSAIERYIQRIKVSTFDTESHVAEESRQRQDIEHLCTVQYFISLGENMPAHF